MIPKNVRIGQRKFKIVIRDKSSDPELCKSYGYTMRATDYIVIRDCMSLAMCRSTLLHEILHALTNIYSNDYTEEIYKMKKDNDIDDMFHYFVGMVEEPLVGIIMDNPSLIRFLSGKTKNNKKNNDERLL